MLFQQLLTTVQLLKNETISNERKIILQPLIDFIKVEKAKNKSINLNFICTHNSRRSHLAQVWAQVAAYFFNVKNIHCYSGGTEATALFPMVVKTLVNAGFKIDELSNGENPIYSIKYTDNEQPIIGFSKTFDNSFNPKSEFTAILTCSQADANCPFISGASQRIAITYNDPKEFDNTPQQAEKYQERSNQIATEMWYVFFQINS